MWPEVTPLNRYVQGGTGTAQTALGSLHSWATWLWGNLDMQHFLEWLRRYNGSLPSGQRMVGFCGLDVLVSGCEPVLQYLDTVNPASAQSARERYNCFDTFGGDHERYGYYAAWSRGDL